MAGRIFRHKWRNTILTDPDVWLRQDLSLEAKGMLIFLMAQPPNRNITAKWVEEYLGIGRHLRRRTFDELEQRGYMRRKAVWSKEKKRYVGWDYEFYDEPLPAGGLPDSAKKPSDSHES